MLCYLIASCPRETGHVGGTRGGNRPSLGALVQTHRVRSIGLPKIVDARRIDVVSSIGTSCSSASVGVRKDLKGYKMSRVIPCRVPIRGIYPTPLVHNAVNLMSRVIPFVVLP